MWGHKENPIRMLIGVSHAMSSTQLTSKLFLYVTHVNWNPITAIFALGLSHVSGNPLQILLSNISSCIQMKSDSSNAHGNFSDSSHDFVLHLAKYEESILDRVAWQQ